MLNAFSDVEQMERLRALIRLTASKPMLPLSMTHQTSIPVLAQCHAQLAGQIMATYAVRDPRTEDEC